MYTNFYKVRDIIESLSSHIDYAQDCLDYVFTFGDSSIMFDSHTKNASITINGEVHNITDEFLLCYLEYDDYIYMYDTMFDDTLDFFYAFLHNCNISFSEMSSNVSKIVEFRKSFGFETDSEVVEFLQEFFLYIHNKLSELDNL